MPEKEIEDLTPAQIARRLQDVHDLPTAEAENRAQQAVEARKSIKEKRQSGNLNPNRGGDNV